MAPLNKVTIGIFLSIAVLAGCRPEVKNRPIGFGNLGAVSKFKDQYVIDVSDHAVLVRQDEKGLFGMSTLCTRELRRLKARTENGAPILFCDVCGSEYNGQGHVVKGPATAGLPYYKLLVAEGVPNGPLDTLYAHVGIPVPESWRLPFPEVASK
jgi:nitrite reductase/ring-hydroxylating ferredoxin subunit